MLSVYKGGGPLVSKGLYQLYPPLQRITDVLLLLVLCQFQGALPPPRSPPPTISETRCFTQPLYFNIIYKNVKSAVLLVSVPTYCLGEHKVP